MWSNLFDALGSFRDYFLLMAVAIIGFTVVSPFLIKRIKWKSVVLKYYGIFVGLKPLHLLALSFILMRMLFFWSGIPHSIKPELAHICFGIMVTLALQLIIANPEVLLFDCLFTALTLFGLHINSAVYAYLSSIQMKGSIVIMKVLIVAFILLTTLYSTVECVRSLAGKGSKEKPVVRRGRIRRHTALLACGLFMTTVPYYFLNGIDSLTVNQTVYQCTAKEKVSYEGSSKVTKSGLGCVLKNKGELYKLADSPLYYTKEKKVLIPNVVSIVQPRLSLINRVANMSEVYGKDEKYYVRNEKGEVKVSDFFIFDGRDTYIFFENIRIAWNDESIELTPFSYITVKYNRLFEVFDSETETFSTIETGACNAVAKMSCGAQLNLSTDILLDADGQEQMLFIQPNLLEDLK